MQGGIAVAEDLDIDPAVALVAFGADVLDRGGDQVDVGEVAHALGPRQVDQTIDPPGTLVRASE